jgi:hypothetical protein
VKRLLPSLFLVALVGAVSVATTGCDASPYAVTINSQVIKQAVLYQELHAWAGNRSYVEAFDAADSTSNGGSGVTVAGDTTKSYNTTWVASIMTSMVAASAIEQHAAATGHIPLSGLQTAARSVSEIDHSGYWEQFSPAFRDVLTTRLATQAAITPATTPAATLKALYSQYQTYFFTEVCVLQASAFSLEAAHALAAGGVASGTKLCYNQSQFEQQPVAFQSAVRPLPLGSVSAPIKTSYGYQVVKVVSRDNQAYGPNIERTLSVAYVTASGAPDPVLNGLLGSAKVRVNPAYGTWHSDQVVAPVAPTI